MELDGLYFTHADQHMDLRTVQRHEAPTAYSRTIYKGPLRDEGRSVYQGLIRVEENASGTDAYLTNNNLVLNDGARSDSIPSLQIGTNDVRCSHGSTTGRIDPLQLFYLMSRGYKESEAVEMLIEGFFDEIVAKLPEILRDELRETIAQRVHDSED
jgi:Fe-S cluster assembly protein SufD